MIVSLSWRLFFPCRKVIYPLLIFLIYATDNDFDKNSDDSLSPSEIARFEKQYLRKLQSDLAEGKEIDAQAVKEINKFLASIKGQKVSDTD